MGLAPVKIARVSFLVEIRHEGLTDTVADRVLFDIVVVMINACGQSCTLLQRTGLIRAQLETQEMHSRGFFSAGALEILIGDGENSIPTVNLQVDFFLDINESLQHRATLIFIRKFDHERRFPV